MLVSINRSKEWLHQQQLIKGENLPTRVEVNVDIKRLGNMARKILLDAGRGSYPNKLENLKFNQTFELNDYSCYGHRDFIIDSHLNDITVEQVEYAIIDAYSTILESKVEHEKKIADRQAAEAEQKAQQLLKAQKLEEAKTLLAAELQQKDDYKQRLDIVSEFLAEIPDDALRVALKARSLNNFEQEKKRIEDASTWVIF